MLLEAGASPEFVDKVSMESAFDVAQNEEVRAVLVSSPVVMFVLFVLFFPQIAKKKIVEISKSQDMWLHVVEFCVK